MLLAMAVSGTVPSSQPSRLQPTTVAQWVRRVTAVLAIIAGTWFFMKFGTKWVPASMNTNIEIPAGSWVIMDRWSSGIRVGSDVFIETPHGEILTRVTKISDTEVFITNPNPNSSWRDSESFGALPRENVIATVLVAFAPEGAAQANDK
jgi:type IV secretory pathway protease TraF